MVTLARGEANSSAKLNWYMTADGVLTNVYEIGFQIWRVTTGYPGTQIFPATPGAFQDVTSNTGRFAVGSYFAWVSGAAAGWTPPATEPLGTHAIKWRWKYQANSAYQQGQEEFEIVAGAVPDIADAYCQVADVRALGLDASAASDDQVIAAIRMSTAIINRVTRQFFVPKVVQFHVDGTDSDAIHFSVPIISLEWVRLNGSKTNLEAGYFQVYNGRSYPDDRGNPRIKLVGTEGDAYRDIYTAPGDYGLRFRKGRNNQEIRGVFGYTEEDGSTPALITRAATKLVLEKLASPLYSPPGGTPPPSLPPGMGGVVIEEETDDHRLKYSTASIASRRPGLSGLTSDQEVLDILKLYKGPIGIAVPAQWSHY